MLLSHFRKAVGDYCACVPFEPFFIELVNGERILVRHPESLSISERGLAYYIGSNSDVERFDHESVARITDFPHHENGQMSATGVSVDA